MFFFHLCSRGMCSGHWRTAACMSAYGVATSKHVYTYLLTSINVCRLLIRVAPAANMRVKWRHWHSKVKDRLGSRSLRRSSRTFLMLFCTMSNTTPSGELDVSSAILTTLLHVIVAIISRSIWQMLKCRPRPILRQVHSLPICRRRL